MPGSRESRAAFSALRVSAFTGTPRPESRFTILLPTSPLAPVT